MIKWITLGFVLLVVGCAIALLLFLRFAPTFGAPASGGSLEKIEASKNFSEGRFANLIDTSIDTSTPDSPRSLLAFIFKPDNKNPKAALPSRQLDSAKLLPDHFVWLGHSSIVFNTGELMVAADPVFYRASPVPFIGNAFSVSNPTTISDLPALDVVIISHDHYDHLDHRAVQQLNPTTRHFLVPLGLSGHLNRWGVPQEKIIELDWYESHTIGDTEFILTPSRHFSGRSFSDRYKTLWGSWVVRTQRQTIFFSGDSGYFSEFKKIGERFGPFDIAFLENGAYDSGWSQIHMRPEQAVQASMDLNARIFFPIHWSKFDLALHPWHEPADRALNAATANGVTMATPLIGQIFSLTSPPQQRWWKK